MHKESSAGHLFRLTPLTYEWTWAVADLHSSIFFIFMQFLDWRPRLGNPGSATEWAWSHDLIGEFGCFCANNRIRIHQFWWCQKILTLWNFGNYSRLYPRNIVAQQFLKASRSYLHLNYSSVLKTQISAAEYSVGTLWYVSVSVSVRKERYAEKPCQGRIQDSP